MSKRPHIILPITAIAAITATPALAFADTQALVLAAGNGPWIALFVVGMLRAMLCLGHSATSGGDDCAF